MISLKNPNYQYVAARLLLLDLRKKVWKGIKPIHLKEMIKENTKRKFYDTEILEKFDDVELTELDNYINHDRDYNFTSAGLKQLCDKYFVKNRITNEVFETPQFMYMLIAMSGFINEEKSVRLKYIKEFYDVLSLFKINLPTPILAGLRTPDRNFASCVLIAAGDTLDSISAASTALMKYASLKSGIGLHPNIRPIGSSVRNGTVKHTGNIPFFRFFQSALKSTSQSGLRDCSANLFYPYWHLECQDFIPLKDNAGTDDTRLRQLDYTFVLDSLFLERLVNDDYITLVDHSKHMDLYDKFGTPEFRPLYEEMENNKRIRKTRIKAIDLFNKFMVQRMQTGRIYLLNIDEANRHTTFNYRKGSKIHGSNLCVEVLQPTAPFENLNDMDGEISLCTLFSKNVMAIKDNEWYAVSYIGLRFLDNLFEHQRYPFAFVEHTVKKRRNVGVGITNLAYFLAKHKSKYSDSTSVKLVHDLMEKISFNLHKASIDLAKERGACEWLDKTYYADGKFPIDSYHKNVDKIAPFELQEDWEGMRVDLIKHGARFSSMQVQMPVESSSLATNSTNGMDPVVDLLISKNSKSGMNRFVVPDFKKLSQYYELAFEMPNNKGYLNIVAVMQKFIDQSLSTNLFYDPRRYPDNNIPMSEMLDDILYGLSLGIKTFYYNKTNDMNQQQDLSCESGACAI